jgi:tol-pal system protein YbgF
MKPATGFQGGFSRHLLSLGLVTALSGGWYQNAMADSDSAFVAVQAQFSQLSRTVLDQQQELRDLQREVRELRGASELLTHQLEEAQRAQRNLYSDMDKRIARLEAGTPPAAQATTGAPALPDSNPVTNPTPPAPIPSATTPDAVPPTNLTLPPLGSAANSQEQLAFQEAFKLLQAEKYEQAGTALAAFVRQYPQSSQADSAQYWLGESFYARRDFSHALQTFTQLLTQYPNSNKRAHALLKIGFTYAELQDAAKAQQILEYVRDNYPSTSQARLAVERLQQLKP